MNFSTFTECAKDTEMLIYKAFGWVYHIHNLTFSDQNLIKKSYFFWCLILGLIFQLLARFDAKMPDSGRPLAPRWIPNGTQNRPSGAKKAQVSQRRSRFFADLLPWSLSDRSWAPVWLIWERLWMDFEVLFVLFVAKLVFFGEWILKELWKRGHQP